MSPAAIARPDELATLTWEALGTSAVVQITDREGSARARKVVEHELDAIDRACSRFRPDSELSRVNSCAGRRVEVHHLLIEALQVALRAAEITDGDVDPTQGRALILAGYDRDWKLIAATNSAPANRQDLRPLRATVLARAVAGWQTVEIDPERCLVRVPRGIQLDLGATAKAWVADRAAEAVHQELGCGALVSLGGDIATAGPGPIGGWRIHVTDDHRAGPDAPGQTVSIISGGLATSSVAARRWTHNGVDMHHIIDPATGAPVRGMWRTASVAAANCTDANIATTAALVRDRTAVKWLKQLGLPARLVEHDGTVHGIGEWPAAGSENPDRGQSL
ncbi:MAG TPA: FAD:protein FMN transferase [Solirubrobacteraceae bacterium]